MHIVYEIFILPSVSTDLSAAWALGIANMWMADLRRCGRYGHRSGECDSGTVCEKI